MSGGSLEVRPGVAAVVRDEREDVLLHRRRVGDGWAPPSGAVEPGEELVDALRRELREETGLEVRVGRLIALYSDPAFQVVAYPGGRRVHFVTALFECDATGGELRGSDEAHEWGWFDLATPPRDLLPYARVWLDDARRRVPDVIVR